MRLALTNFALLVVVAGSVLCVGCATSRMDTFTRVEMRTTRWLRDEFDHRMQDVTFTAERLSRTADTGTRGDAAFRVLYSRTEVVEGSRRDRVAADWKSIETDITIAEYRALLLALRSAGIHRLVPDLAIGRAEATSGTSPMSVRLKIGDGDGAVDVNYWESDETSYPYGTLVRTVEAFGDALVASRPGEARTERLWRDGDLLPAREVTFADLLQSPAAHDRRRVSVTGYLSGYALYPSATNRTDRLSIGVESTFSEQPTLLTLLAGWDGWIRIEGVFIDHTDISEPGILMFLTRLVPLAEEGEASPARQGQLFRDDAANDP